jgi:tRNA guanosine-2'-O-methyltransferase
VFDALREPMHGQIRYFMEVFCTQCSRKYPPIFGQKIAEQITRRDLNIQEISSIMVVAGNLIVGKYLTDFLFDKDVLDTHTVLAGATPLLRSTQGFSRGIAQLLVHALIPLAIDTKQEGEPNDSDWHLRSLFRFPDEKPDMKRLRTKQRNFFERYDADTTCTPEYIFTIPVDEGGDANPECMVDVIKQCLSEVYENAHGDDVPNWKRVQDMIESEEAGDGHDEAESSHEVNFQRKIIPLETLNLAFEEARERRLRNVTRRRKQPLIVCASLIDKVPNLGGLAPSCDS